MSAQNQNLTFFLIIYGLIVIIGVNMVQSNAIPFLRAGMIHILKRTFNYCTIIKFFLNLTVGNSGSRSGYDFSNADINFLSWAQMLGLVGR
jgi:hypothetical protein